MHRPNNARRSAALSLAAIGMLVAAAEPALSSDDYLDRSDTLTRYHGDAMATNKAIQYITRWPRASRDAYWLSDGERARTAIVRYKTGKVIPPKTLSNKVGASSEMPPTPDTPVQPGPAAATK